MVFQHEPDGPHSRCPRTAQDNCGFYKIRCAEAIRASSPAACIVRLGWQIDPDARGNNMLAALNAQQARDGCIRASTRWRPACSFMADTVAALRMLLEVPVAETVHLDSKAREGYSFAELVSALRTTYGCEHWVLNQTADYVPLLPAADLPAGPRCSPVRAPPTGERWHAGRCCWLARITSGSTCPPPPTCPPPI